MVGIKRGDIFLANLEPVVGNEQGGIRPVLVIQNDISNKYSPVIIIAMVTSRIYEKEYPTNVFIKKEISSLDRDSTILLNQIRTVDKRRIIRKLSTLDNFTMHKVDLAIRISLGIE